MPRDEGRCTSLLILWLQLALAGPSETGQLWTGLEVDIGLHKRLTLELGADSRIGLTSTEETTGLFTFATEVKLTRRIEAAVGYRLELGPRGLGHRLAFDLGQQVHFDKLRLLFRYRYTASVRNNWKHTVRVRLGLQGRLPSFRPFLKVEPFVRVDDTVRLRKVRISVGTDLPVQRGALPDFTLVYHLEQFTDGQRRHIGAVGLSWDLDPYKARKRKAREGPAPADR